MERDEINDSGVGFRAAIEGLENQLFFGDWVTDIGKVVCCLFNFLEIIVNREIALFEGLKLFFEMNGTIILIVSKQICKRLPQVMGICCFREYHT